jgi:hypothetical protein
VEGTAATGTYVYAIVSAGDARNITLPASGVKQASVATVTAGGLAGVVSPVGDHRVRAARADLTAHEAVVEAVAAQASVLPLQFGVVMPGEDALVTDLLRDRAGELTDLLDTVAGKREYRLRAAYAGDTLLRQAVESSPAIRRLQEQVRGGTAGYHDRIRLGEAVAAAVATVKDGDTTRILARLAGAASATVVLPTRDDDMAIHVAALVADGEAAAFDGAVDALAAEAGERLALHLVGPLAPWDFVTPGAMVAGPSYAGAR